MRNKQLYRSKDYRWRTNTCREEEGQTEKGYERYRGGALYREVGQSYYRGGGGGGTLHLPSTHTPTAFHIRA